MTLPNAHMRYLEPPSRKGVREMKANDLLIYSILRNNEVGLFRNEIIEELTYRQQCRLGKNTITKSLQNLELNGLIKVSKLGRKKFYKPKYIGNSIDHTYHMSYAAVHECVKNNISTGEFRLYCYMRYLHNKQQYEEPKTLRGNLFYYSQQDLAKGLGCTQGRISQMINNLIDKELLTVWDRQPSKNNGYDYYIYKFNY